jgi:mannose-6-phosphate isomerase-like protein (cupin superfamily)
MTSDARILPVREGEDLGDAPFRFLNGEFHRKVSGSQTGGALCVFDTIRTQQGDPALHVHHEQDEWFFVTEGEFIVAVGGVRHRLRPGDSILGPRGVPHAFRNTTETGRIVVAFAPAGTMEAFFEEGAAINPMTPGAFAELSSRHGMTVVGPPLEG